MILSPISTCVELIVVVLPWTFKSPLIINVPELSPTVAGSIVIVPAPVEIVPPAVASEPNVIVPLTLNVLPNFVVPEISVLPVIFVAAFTVNVFPMFVVPELLNYFAY